MPLVRTTLICMSLLTACGSSYETFPVATQHDFQLACSPIYSAFDGVHDYRVPIIAVQQVVDSWTIVNRSGVPQAGVADIVKDESFGGAMLTTRKSGDYVVLARAGAKLGCAELHITSGTNDEWALGEARYHEALPHSDPPARVNNLAATMYAQAACEDCHGADSTKLASVSTSRQTAGFSDQELSDLFTNGTEPSSVPLSPASFDSICPPLSTQHSETLQTDISRYYHVSETTPDQVAALILYLRSVPPMPEGSLDFAGAMPLQSDAGFK